MGIYNYQIFRKMCLQFKLKYFGMFPEETLMVAWYQHNCRYYDENMTYTTETGTKVVWKNCKEENE